MNTETVKINTLITNPLEIDTLVIKKWAGDNFRPVNKFYRSQKHKGSASGDEQIFVIYQGEDIVAAVRLVPHPNYFWLRGLYVKSELRGQRLGSLLLKQIHEHIALPIYCFPYEHLQGFYNRSGYQLLELQQLPEAMRDLYKRYSRKGTAIINMGSNVSS